MRRWIYARKPRIGGMIGLKEAGKASSKRLAGRLLSPGRLSEEQEILHAPQMVGEARGYGGGTKLPEFGRAIAIGGNGLRQRQTQGVVRKAEIIVGTSQGDLLCQSNTCDLARGCEHGG